MHSHVDISFLKASPRLAAHSQICPLFKKELRAPLVTNFKGIIRPFELKEIYISYYLIDAGEFSYSNDMH